MSENNIQVPRDDISNKNVTKEIESLLLNTISDNPEEAFTYKELKSLAKSKLGAKYGDGLDAHVGWALDMLHFNNMVKRVAPGTFQSVDGPDEVYTERETGHAGEGEFSNRGKNVKGIVRVGSKSEFNKELSKSLVSVRLLKNMGHSESQIISELPPDKFNPVAVKLAVKQMFGGIKADTTDLKDE